MFFVALFACKEREEFDSGMDAEFDPNDRVGTGCESSYKAGLKQEEKPLAAAAQAETELGKVVPDTTAAQ